MPALSFKPEFVPFIENGTKVHTIRTARKHPIQNGDMLRLYTGMRTKQCRLIKDWTKCVAVQEIEIIDGDGVFIDGIKLTVPQLTRFAFNDGFRVGEDTDLMAFWNWFCPSGVSGQFVGDLISWGFHEFMPF